MFQDRSLCKVVPFPVSLGLRVTFADLAAHDYREAQSTPPCVVYTQPPKRLRYVQRGGCHMVRSAREDSPAEGSSWTR